MPLPPEQKLAGQLCSVRFTMTPNGIAAERKDEVVKRLGRSPDRADAVVMAGHGVVSRQHRRLAAPDVGAARFGRASAVPGDLGA